MKTKIIIGILAFSTTFGASTALLSLTGNAVQPPSAVVQSVETETQQSILKFLRQDISNGRSRSDNIVSAENYSSDYSAATINIIAAAVNEYTDKSSSLNDADLPAEFQNAWRVHMKAWKEQAIFLNSMRRSEMRQKIDADKFAKIHAAHSDEISSTWWKVLDVADKYNAVPCGAY